MARNYWSSPHRLKTSMGLFTIIFLLGAAFGSVYAMPQPSVELKHEVTYSSVGDEVSLSHCRDIGKLPGDKCQYVLENCSEPTSGFGNYLEFYYCTMRNHQIIGCGLLLFATMYTFLMLGTAAGEYLCPNLSNISSWLHLSESVAGVTLAAIGNGAPDLFSTFSAMRAETAGLAIGELLGAAMFITLVVVGAVAITTPFKLPRRPFIRDAVAFIGALLLVLIICADKKITHLEGWTLILYYMIYVTVVIVSAWIYRRQKAERLQSPPLEVSDPHHSNEPREELSPVSIPATPLSVVWTGVSERDMPFFETDALLGNREDDDDSLYDEDGFDAEFFLPHFKPSKLPHDFLKLPTSGVLVRSWSSHNDNFRRARSRSPERRSNHLSGYGSEAGAVVQPTEFNGSPVSATPANEWEAVQSVLSQPDDGTPRLWDVDGDHGLTALAYCDRLWAACLHCRDVLERLFPALFKWRSLSVWQKMQAFLFLPLYLAFSLTIPAVHQEEMELDIRREKAKSERQLTDTGDILVNSDEPEEDGDVSLVDVEDKGPVITFKTLNRELTIIQLAIAPIFTAFALQELTSYVGNTPIPVWVLCIALGAVLATVGFYATRHRAVIKYGRILALCGFFMSVIWIYVIASEVVGMLGAMASIFGVSETVMGLTLFAIGNSVGDLMTNISIARMGYPTMAVGACFGSPMLNLVLGIGVTSTYITAIKGEPYLLRHSLTPAYVCAVSLVLALFGSIIYISATGFKATRRYGAALIALYGVLMVAIVLVSNSGY
ncbi:uncharacterized protein SPPG_07444 [Spizellomyces punctatus DAOM BR117]|uniref:Sodium/calcium exchanger membrane region domain-containing protein n=1 Tax=Spizellomyces punctatus (strain DAOM BR117) TaxID=645134 RepID=A0A0L0H7Y7_SPIPD|nr:uncharacterized protein SPPG_07444 [Spizellomyces punctatus DAOM BR117]KNC97046.1 hypothetical protein SPPG_07444 [Spizellomyces punctatus DAOM BR117]|eukprot:XP_016605086.1 hypothetical protein SPPG_07444 [Spizellomyces punctatus DAOM BR117]